MEAILNQSDEDMYVNDLIMRIKIYTELNINKKMFMDECYESHITAQSLAYDCHILKEGTPPLYWEDNNQYFESVLYHFHLFYINVYSLNFLVNPNYVPNRYMKFHLFLINLSGAEINMQ